MTDKMNGFTTEAVTFPPFVRRGVTTGLVVPVGATTTEIMEVAVEHGSFYREKQGETTATKFVVRLQDGRPGAFTQQGLEDIFNSSPE